MAPTGGWSSRSATLWPSAIGAGRRSDGATFIVMPTELHVDREIEDITERTDTFWVVKKRGVAAELTRQVDPRVVGLRGAR
jgi:hypothetical protein